MSDPDYYITERALRTATEEFSKNPKAIYGSESSFRRAMQESRNSSFRKWSRSKPCSFGDCIARSIEKSHAIPSGMMVDSVALKGHVMTPERNGSGELIVSSLGVKEASVFPGYCNTHESLFQGFEKKKSIDTDKEKSLQIYRSTDRELYRAKHWYEQLKAGLDDYIIKRDAFILRRTNELLFPKIGRRLAKLPNFAIEGRQLHVEQRLADLREIISTLETQFLPYAKSCAFSDGSDKNGVIYKIEVPFAIPVALSGYGDIRTTQKLIRLVLGVIPQKEKTNIFMLGAAGDKSVLDEYWDQRTNNINNILSMISSWMIHGTDQWYFHPAEWKKIDEETRVRIISGIGQSEFDIAASAENIFSRLSNQYKP